VKVENYSGFDVAISAADQKLFEALLNPQKSGSGNGSNDGSSSSSSSGGNGDATAAKGEARPENNGQSDFNPNATANANSGQSGQADNSTQGESKERVLSEEAAKKPEQQVERDMAREAEIAARNIAHTQGISGREKDELVFAARTAGQFGGKDADIQAIVADTHLKVTGRAIDQQQSPAVQQQDYLAQAVAAARGIGVSGIIHDLGGASSGQLAKQTNNEQKRETGLENVPF